MNFYNTSPLATWLLCTNREDRLLHRAIRSCLQQSIENHELLIVANGCEAGKLEHTIARMYSDDSRVRVVSTNVRYLNFSLSLGLHLARSQLIARMDADDVSHPERLDKQIRFMESNQGVVVLGSAYNLIDENENIHGVVDVPMYNEDIRKALRFRNPICHPSVMLRRDAVLRVGGYLGGINSEDYDLWIRLAENNSNHFFNLAEPLLSYNVSTDGAARRSRGAYASSASAQLRQFLVARDPRWFIGSALSSVKALLLANKE